MQYRYCSISQQVWATSQGNLVSEQNITWETFFLKDHTQSVVEKLFPDPFIYKTLNYWRRDNAQIWLFIKVKFEHISRYIVGQVVGYWNILKLSCRPLAFTSHKTFLKNEKMPGTSCAASFSAWFLKVNISLIFY